MGIPLTVVLLLIQKAEADELDEARDVFRHARPGVTSVPAEPFAYGDDDEGADDLDEGEDEYDEGEVYDDEYDSDEYYDPDDDEDDTEDQDAGPTMS